MGISYLIDTHILLWWLFDDPKLNAQCRDIIRNPDFKIIVSTVSLFGIRAIALFSDRRRKRVNGDGIRAIARLLKEGRSYLL